MWRVMVSSSRTAEKVLLELLRLLEDWPLHSMGALYRDARAFLPLAVSFWSGLGSPQGHPAGGSPSTPTTASPCPARRAGRLR